jgi:hypothetical protein
MARIGSVHREPPATIPNRVCNSTNQRIHRHRAGICLAGVILAWSACAVAQSGPGVALKAGFQTLEDPIDRDNTTRFRLEVELSTPPLLDEHLDVALAFGTSPLGSYDDDYVDVYDDGFIAEHYDDALSVFDVRLAARLYPLGDATEIRPYLGAGIGYFWLFDYWEYEYEETIDDPLFPEENRTYRDEYEDTDTLADGVFAFVTAGLTFPLGSRGELILEFQYDFEKENGGFDLGGPIYMIGGRLRF